MNARWLLAPALALASCHSSAQTPTTMPQSPTVVAASAYESKARALVTNAAEGRFDAATSDFDATMAKAMSPGDFATTWKQIEAKLGAFERIEKIEMHDEKGFHVAVVTTKLAHERIAFRIPFDDAAKVAGFWVKPAEEKAAATYEAPTYVTKDAFHERQVQVGALPGTLTLPNGAGPFPVVVLVHGSGPHDEDETILGSKPFKDLAWGLASQGVAALRYKKQSQGIVTQKEEVIDAVHDAIALLSKTSDIDPKRIYVVGHSQGGYLAPRIAQNEPSLRGIALLAGSTIPLEDSIVNQLAYFSSLVPGDSSLKEQVAAAKEFKAKVESPSLRAEEKVTFPGSLSTATGAYFLDVRDYRPIATAAKLSCRILVLQGERDYQVTPNEYADWKAGLTGRDATFHLYPALNHLFMHGEGPPSPAEYSRPGQHVDAQVVSDLATWVKAK